MDPFLFVLYLPLDKLLLGLGRGIAVLPAATDAGELDGGVIFAGVTAVDDHLDLAHLPHLLAIVGRVDGFVFFRVDVLVLGLVDLIQLPGFLLVGLDDSITARVVVGVIAGAGDAGYILGHDAGRVSGLGTGGHLALVLSDLCHGGCLGVVVAVHLLLPEADLAN